MNVRWLGWALVSLLGGCATTPPLGGGSATRGTVSTASGRTAAEVSVRDPSRCDKAATLRSQVARWLEEGKLHRSLGAIEDANLLCPETSKATRLLELELLVELGRHDAARGLAGELSTGMPSVEEQAATERALSVIAAREGASRDQPAFEGNMREAWRAARVASREGRYAEASSLLLEGWSKWSPTDVFALIDAGSFARKAGKVSESQRLFDRGLEELERRYETTVRVELSRTLWDIGEMVWVPSTEFVAVADAGDLVLVDADSLKERLRWTAHDKIVSIGDDDPLLVASPDGRWLASAFNWESHLSYSEDSLIRVWRASDGKPISTIEGPVGHLSALAISPDGKVVASVGRGPGVRLNRLEDGVLLRVLRGHEEPPRVVAFSPEGTLLASGAGDGTVRLVRLADGSPMREVKGFGEAVTGLAFFKDAGTLLVGTKDGRFCRVRVEDGKVDCSPKTRDRTLRDITILGKGPMVAATTDSGPEVAVTTNSSVGIWDGSTGKQRGTVGRSDKKTRYVDAAFSPSQGGVVLRNDRGVLSSFRTRGNDDITAWNPHDVQSHAACDASGTMMASWTYDGTIIWLWRRPGGALLGRLSGHEKSITGVAFDPKGTFLASSSTDGSVRLWNTADGSLVRIFPGTGKDATSVAFSPDGKSIWAGFEDGTLRRWSMPDGKLQDAPDAEGEPVETLALSADGALVAVGTARGRVHIWRAGDGRPVCSSADWTDSTPRYVTRLAFTPDGHRVVGITSYQDVNVWSTRDCQSDPSFKPPRLSQREEKVGMGRFEGFALSPDGTFLATNYGDGSVRLLSTRDGAELRSFRRERGNAWSVSITPDSHQLLFATNLGLEVWNIDGTEPHLQITTNREHDAIVTLAGSGRYFDIVGKGEAFALDNMAVCRIGPVSLPLEVCAERTRVPGLGTKLAAVGGAGIEP